MKKSIFLALVACFSLTAMADDFSLYIENTSEEKTSYRVSELQKITFSDGNVVLSHTDGQTTQVAISKISTMYFDTASTDAIELVKNGEISLEGATVYDLAGRRVNGLQRGVNIVKTADGRSIKIVKK